MSSSNLLKVARELKKEAFDRDYGESALLGGTLGAAMAAGTLPSALAGGFSGGRKATLATLAKGGNVLLRGYGLGSLIGLGAHALTPKRTQQFY